MPSQRHLKPEYRGPRLPKYRVNVDGFVYEGCHRGIEGAVGAAVRAAGLGNGPANVDGKTWDDKFTDVAIHVTRLEQL